MKPISKNIYEEFKEIDRYDFTHPKFVYYEGLRMTKYDIAFHLELTSRPRTPWTMMYDAFYYADLKGYLKTRLKNIQDERKTRK